jgi:exopolysaccharide biosynthesis WecB/TagA/CpsF family protein
MAISSPQAITAVPKNPAREALAKSLLGAAKPSSALWQRTEQTSRKVRLFGLAIDNTLLTSAARDLVRAALDQRRTRVVFVNAHVVNETQKSATYHATVASADRIYADGSGMAIAARICEQPLADNVNGTDLFPLLCREAIAQSTTIFLLGGKPGVAAAAAQTIADFGMGQAIAGTHHGYFAPGSADEDRVIAMINNSGAGIVLVGFGVPLQDAWVQQHAGRITAPVVAGVGGLFDFFSGAVSRSPKFMRSMGAEWVWRLALEPRRMARRYLIGNVVFLAHAVRDRSAARAEQSRAGGQSAAGVAAANASTKIAT